MTTHSTRTGLQLRSLARANGQLELSLVSVPVPDPLPDEVLVRIDATPLNPSDLGLLFGAADMSTATYSGTAAHPVVTATIPPERMRAVAGRLDQSMPVGNEGAGVVVAAGASDEAQALLGKTVAVIGGAMYSQYRSIKAEQCLVLPEGTTAAEGASCFINPLTALGMVETMRREGHTALVHTAAASNLGQMLNKICLADEVGLVNIVRSQEQADTLRALGAVHVCNSTSPAFMRGPDRGGRGDGGHARVRRHRRRSAGGADPDLHGSRGQQERHGIQPLRLDDAQAGVRLRSSWTCGRSNSAAASAWRGASGGWLLFPFLQKIGAASGAGAPRACRRGVEDDLRQPLRGKPCRWPKRSSRTRLPPTAGGPPGRNISSPRRKAWLGRVGRSERAGL